jgi:hypothetical protein
MKTSMYGQSETEETVEMIGKRFGSWLVVSEAEPYHKKGFGYRKRYNCLCDCGKEKVVWGHNLKNGVSTSCGCSRIGKPKYSKSPNGKERHEYAISKLSDVYYAMKKRCYSPKSISYKNYGLRGITVCDEWLGDKGSLNFYRWAIDNGYKEGLSLDRIDNEKGYSPENCRWATRQQQNDNKRTSRLLTYNGETKTMTQWARMLGFKSGDAIALRLKRGWSIEEAVTIKKTKSYFIKHYRESKLNNQ